MGSVGRTLMDTLDELIGERRIEPQLAMKILSHFDRSITEVLQDKVKARMTFKVCVAASWGLGWKRGLMWDDIGTSRHLPLLRRGMDLPDQGRDIQDGEHDGAGG